MEGVLEEIIMNNQPKLSKFSHVMNDDMIGTTFIYFNSETVQDLDKGTEQEYGEHCIWLDEQDHKKLEAALKREPYDCTVFTKKETEWIKKWFTEVRDCVGDFDYYKGEEMTTEEWNVFKEKIG